MTERGRVEIPESCPVTLRGAAEASAGPDGSMTAMTDLFDYIPHPHVAARQEAGPPKVAAAVATVHGPGPIGRFNAKVGLKITLIVGTMWCAYVFSIVGALGIEGALTNNVGLVLIIGSISGYFLQLVLLPIIIVGQNVQADAADARSQATYDDASAVLEEAKQIQVHLLAQDEAIQRILARLQAQTGS